MSGNMCSIRLRSLASVKMGREEIASDLLELKEKLDGDLYPCRWWFI